MLSADPTLPTPKIRAAIPRRLRVLVRGNEIGLIALAALVGAIAGLLVVAASSMAALMHEYLFGAAPHGHVSNLPVVLSLPHAAVPVAGGLLIGTIAFLIRRWHPRRPVDPIEANALQGGRMSLIDSFLISVQTVLSNGVGASVGLEAGYTQIGSGIASRIGVTFRLRRADLRMLVGCGSAGAIGAAFGAPLTGAFYAFELIIGTYTPFGLAPIVAASISGVLVTKILGIEEGFIGQITSSQLASSQLASSWQMRESDLALLFALAILCAGMGIAIMRAVTLVEALFKRSRIPLIFQPAIGGAVVGGLALISPQVLASGRGALFDLFHGGALVNVSSASSSSAGGPSAIGMLLVIILMKSVASAISIGAGFRGGLFFASLFLGAMIGWAFAGVLTSIDPQLVSDPAVFGIVGMAALAVAIIGGPLTMTFLALETTGDFVLSLVMLGASTVVSVVVRRTFGYSFATWRLHLRGESIRSAQDVGWMRRLTVARLMRPDVRTARLDMTLADFREEFPLGSTQWAVIVDKADRYVGLVSVPDAHLAEVGPGMPGLENASLAPLLRCKGDVLLPQMNIKEAVDLFERSENEALAVIEDRIGLRVVGILSESYVLRRYTEELDKARRDLSGENWLREG